MLAADTTFPVVEFVDPTPEDEATQMIGIVDINVNITEENLTSLTYNWDGTNYTAYDDSLALMFNLDNVSSLGENNNHVFDVSGNGNNGTANGDAAPVTGGKYFGAYTFDGAGDYVQATQTDLATGADPRTIMAWINATDTDTIRVPFAYGKSGGTDNYKAFGVYLPPDEVLQFWGAGSADFSTGTTLTTNVWHHVAVTYDGSDVRVYLDAKQVGPTTARILDTGNMGFFIGSDGDIDPADYHYSGLVDEVMVWNRALSSDEIYQHYASNLHQVNQTHWQFNVTQAKNTDEELDIGTYTYQAFATDQNSNTNSTEERSISIVGITPPVPEASTLTLTAVGSILIIGVIAQQRRKKK